MTSKSNSAPALLAGNVAQFVQNQQIQLAKLITQPQELPFFFSLQEQRDQLSHAEEANLAALAQAAMPSTVARCDLPVPEGPTSRMFSRRSR